MQTEVPIQLNSQYNVLASPGLKILVVKCSLLKFNAIFKKSHIFHFIPFHFVQAARKYANINYNSKAYRCTVVIFALNL